MVIKIGDAIPNVKLQILTSTGLQDISTEKLFRGNVIMFGIPGAYTPSCSEKHLPGFLQTADTLKKNGIDQIVCLSVNDPYALYAWSIEKQVQDKILMLPDGNGKFTEALGLELDGSSLSLGVRCKRFSMLSEDGIVKDLQVEENFVDVDVTSALCMMGRMGIH